MQEQHTHDDAAPKKPPLQRYKDEHQDKPIFFLGRKQDIKDEAIEDLSQMAKDAWQIIAKANTRTPQFFLSSNKPAYLSIKEQVDLQLLTPAMLKSVLNEMAYFYFLSTTMDDEGDVKREYRTRTAPNFLIAQMLNNPLFDYPLPELVRIVYAPYFTEQHTLHQQPGYNKTAKTYYHLTDERLKDLNIAPQPTQEQVDAAKDLILKHLLVDFPFSSEAERAHAVCVLLQPFIRSWFDVTPFYLIESARAGTGKGLLGDVLTSPFLGEMPTRSPEPKNSEGWTKLITTLLLTIPAVVFFDNIKRPVNDGSLESILTNPVWGDRMLGSNTHVRMINQATWLFAGNNVQIGEEIGRRTVRIRMVAKTANPNQRREFVHPELRDWAQSHRAEIVGAALTLVQHWIALGKPVHANCPTLGSYEKWSRIMHAILTANNIPGFLGNLQEMIDLDKSDWDDITALIQEIWLLTGENVFRSSDIFEIVKSNEDLPVDLGSGAERQQRIVLGKLLGRNRDRVFLVEEQVEKVLTEDEGRIEIFRTPVTVKSEVQLVMSGNDNRAALWKLHKLTERWIADVATQDQADKLYDIWTLECENATKTGQILPKEPEVLITPPPEEKSAWAEKHSPTFIRSLETPT